MSNKALEPKKYKEKFIETIYEKVYSNVSEESGTEYPKNKVVANLYEYSGEYVNRDNEIVAYSGEKIKIENVKLVLEDGQFVRKKKVVGDKQFDDKTEIVMSKENFEDFVQFIQSGKDK